MSTHLQVEIDVPEPRVQNDRIVRRVSGRDWDLPESSNVWVDSISLTGILAPLPATPEWLTTFTGNYARLRKSQYNIAGSADWDEFVVRGSGDYFVQGNGVNDAVYTNASLDINRPMYLAWYSHGVGNEVFVQMECGWGFGSEAEVSLRFYSDGNVEVWKNGLYRGTGSINKEIYYPTEDGPQVFSQGRAGRNLSGSLVEVLLIPGRSRDLLVNSNQGGGFVFFFEDISEDDPNPIVTGAGKFWWQVPEGTPTVQCAIMHFKTSGYFLSDTFQWKYAPATGRAHEELVTYDLPGYGTQTVSASLVEDDGTTLFVPDGSKRDARLKVNLTGDGNSTPFIYAAASAFVAEVSDSPDYRTDLSSFWLSSQLSVPDDPTQVTLKIECKDPTAIEAAGAFYVKTIGNRDVRAFVGDQEYFRGRSGDPAVIFEPSSSLERVILDCHDRWIINERHLISDPEPLDNVRLDAALTYLVKLAGFSDSDLDIGEIDYPLPSLGQETESKEEFALIPAVGDSSGDWILRLHEEFARTYYWGWVPTASGLKFRFKSPSQLGTTSQKTLYLTRQAMLDAGFSSSLAPRVQSHKWIYEYEEKVISPEANDFFVLGRDPKTHKPLIAHYRDTASVNNQTAPIDWPTNSLREIRQYAWIDPALTNWGHVFYVLGLTVLRLGRPRTIAEFESQFLIRSDGAPVWRGDVVTVQGRGDFRIISFEGVFDLEKSGHIHINGSLEDIIERRFKYVAEKI